MALFFHIQNMSTGEVRIYREDISDPGSPWNQNGEFYGKDGFYDGPDYQWGGGNYSCDCNRVLFWHRAAGQEPPPDEETPCSPLTGPVRFPVRKVTDDSGAVVFDGDPRVAWFGSSRE
jgi:hypothetical protein